MEITVRNATIEDSDFLSHTVMGALGEELCLGLAGHEENIEKVRKMFERLAARDDSQYSYQNALIAISPSGETIGAIIGYDGARLKQLRKAFIREANATLGWNLTEENEKTMKDEATPDEFYLDSLYIVPQFRGHGVGSRLINAAIESNRLIGKPFGLLVEPENLRAKKLYEELGFKEAGTNFAFGTEMIHMQKIAES